MIMETTERNEKIKEIIADTFCVGIETVVGDANWDDLGADSLDVVELVMAIEEHFDCEIADEHAEKLATVQDCFDYAEENNLTR